jgi:hypothetical protein
MRSRVLMLAVLSLLVAGANVAIATHTPPWPAGVGHTIEGKGVPQPITAAAPASPALPPGVPPAALAAAPVLAEPTAWPTAWGDGFPRTSGAGRYQRGAFFWSDFLYDDNGAIGVPPPTNESNGAPSPGTYRYPEPTAHANGADIFRVAIGRAADGATTWRVDWNTLADPAIPAAVFALDLDDDTATGDQAWPGNAALASPGIDAGVVLSAAGAWLVQEGTSIRVASTAVEGRSFVATIPASVLAPSGTSVVRVAAGLADPEGDELRTLDAEHGALPGQPNVYNVAFRDYTDETPVRNAWFDSTQVAALTGGGDVSAFAVTLDWARLADGATDPEPLFSGWTNRWYVSSDELGHGIGEPPAGFDGGVIYLGRVQPYGIFVPSTYDGSDALPLTWMLHGALSNHNSAPAVSPKYLDAMCEDRGTIGSICVSPLGRGPNGSYSGPAELDFWEVWNRVASAYRLDPDGTILSGFSMGGYGTYKLAMNHPEAFSAAAPLAANAVAEDEGDIRGGTGLHRLPNLRWTPMYIWQGVLDELVPVDGAIATVDALDELDQRYVFDLYPAEDHVVSALQDGFEDVAEFMESIDATHRREAVPPHITYTWTAPTAYQAGHGLGATGAWWVTGLAVRDDSGTAQAKVDATSHAVGGRSIVPVRTPYTPRPGGHPTPALRRTLSWQPDAPLLPQSALVELALENTRLVSVDIRTAGLRSGGKITVTTDGVVDALTLPGLHPRAMVSVDGGAPVRVGSSQVFVVRQLATGGHTIVLS